MRSVVVSSGRPVPLGGWFVDCHGHRLFLRRGELAPICPMLGPAATSWQLLVEVPDHRRS
jgi:hypothetical protein